MYWAPFFHIYQPPGQMSDILERIVNESYRKLVRGLKENPRARITLNINASLTEQLAEHGYTDVIDGIKTLAERGQIEFTESAKYHAFLPLTPWEEIVRQITINHETNRHFFGSVYDPKGFFPPEMAYSRKVADVVASRGYRWIIVDEIAYNGKVETVPYDQVFTIKDLKGFQVFFRERRLSNLIMAAIVRSKESLLEVMAGEEKKDRYLLTAMDGETFGHHRPGLEKLLFEIFSSPKLQLITLSEIPNYFRAGREVDPVASTWSSTEQNIIQGTQFISWNDPENPIHAWQWELQGHALKAVEKLGATDSSYSMVRTKMDQAFSSDHLWWAGAKPWWSLEMIERGAWRLLDVLHSIPNVAPQELKKGEELYQRIVLKAFEWQRTGYVRTLAAKREQQVRIPFKARTILAGKPEVYHAFIDTMRKEMEKAARKGEFEKAILWRDAIIKIENQDDIYDAIHAADLLRTAVPGDELERSMDEYKKQYKKIRGGQPEQRG